jgi:hypothetical protein
MMMRGVRGQGHNKYQGNPCSIPNTEAQFPSCGVQGYYLLVAWLGWARVASIDYEIIWHRSSARAEPPAFSREGHTACIRVRTKKTHGHRKGDLQQPNHGLFQPLCGFFGLVSKNCVMSEKPVRPSVIFGSKPL